VGAVHVLGRDAEHALPGTLEIGPFVQWTHFDDDAPGAPKDHIGFGGRVGVFLSDTHWELEGDGQNTKTERDRTVRCFPMQRGR
jgi:hypothetical protein